MNELLIGFLFLAPVGLFLLFMVSEAYDALAAWLRRRQSTRPDDSIASETGFYVGGTSFNLRRSGSRLRRRHRRRLELEPRGRWGFAAKWIRDP